VISQQFVTTAIIAMPLGPTMSAFSGDMNARAPVNQSWPKIDKRRKVGWFRTGNEILPRLRN
jgi:hypothetical protein